jgi:iduronate 2-sulfatase
MGKVFHMAKRDDPQSWTLPFIDERDLTYPAEYGAPVMKHYQLPAMKEQVAYFNETNQDFDRDDLIKLDIHPATESLDVPDNAYADGAMALRSIELLETFKTANNPFFMTIGFHRPHLPFVAPKKYWDLYDRSTIEVAAYQEEAKDSPSYAYHKSGELHNYSDIPSNLDMKHPLDKEKQRELIHGYYASVSYVDAQIGLVLDHLQNIGLADNTVVVLIGDHGWHLGDHGLWNKHTNFEQATRTPMIVYTPEMSGSITIDAPTELVDVFPTICDYAGIEIPSHLQGQSLRPLISGEVNTLKPVAMSQYPRNNLMGYSARSDRYRYTEWHKKGAIMEGVYVGKDIKDRELYDYQEDPLETKNLIVDPAYKDVVKEMRGYLKDVLVKD